jgi:ABC-type glycerol-3-phosphate transport system substrate-binding protein
MALALSSCAPAVAPTAAPVAAPTVADAPAEEPVVEVEAAPAVVEVEATPEAEDVLEGEIVISIDSNDVQTYQALADAYMELHPKVRVIVELKPSGGNPDAYNQWLRAQFAVGVPRVSIIESPHLRDLIQEGKILNWDPYLQQVNPYTGEVWEESFETWGLNLVRDPGTDQMFMLPYMSVQTFWVYNKSIFAEAGITDVPAQPTWDQFVEWCEKIREAGYIAIAQEGTVDRMWGGGKHPWLVRSAMDQYTRDHLVLAQCQPGDWCFRDGIDDNWVFDPTDPRNDDPTEVSVNIVRHLIALRDGQIRFDQPWMVAMLEQIGRAYKTENGYVPAGWAGLTDAYPLFLTQKAAMMQTTGGFTVSFPKDIAKLAEGAYHRAPKEDDPTPTPSADEKAAVVFEYGIFAFPTHEGGYVQGNARANELTQGYLAIPAKDRGQNELEVDFVMFWTSPQGMRIFLENKLDPNNLQGGISGPPLIRGVELPEPWASVFGNMTFVGNYEKPAGMGDKVARGFWLYEPTKREWAIMMQQFYAGEITAEQFAEDYQKLLEDHWEELLEFLNITPEDLENPEKQPPNYVGAGPY